MDFDEKIMSRALTLAKRALGFTRPNPVVGAVITTPSGRIIGEGWHHGAGLPHAEIEAIRNAGKKLKPGMTIYVTLEPCSSWGRTPPCTDAILKNRFSRVVIGCTDPNPHHAGRAVSIFESAGINVVSGVLEKRCRELNEPFFHWITTKKPLVLLKMASTLDGKCATRSGDSKWITGTAARNRVQQIRKAADAILVGAETLRLDSPQLTVRDSDGNVLRTPLRFVASRHPVTVPGFERADLSGGWESFLLDLGRRSVMMLLIEGGGELAGSALQAGIVDKIEFHYAPKILCGRSSRPVIGGTDPCLMKDAIPLSEMKISRAGNDFIISGRIIKP